MPSLPQTRVWLILILSSWQLNFQSVGRRGLRSITPEKIDHKFYGRRPEAWGRKSTAVDITQTKGHMSRSSSFWHLGGRNLTRKQINMDNRNVLRAASLEHGISWVRGCSSNPDPSDQYLTTTLVGYYCTYIFVLLVYKPLVDMEIWFVCAIQS